MVGLIVVLAVSLVIGVYVFAMLQTGFVNTTYTNQTVGYMNQTGLGTAANVRYMSCVPVIAGSYTIYNSTTPYSLQNTLTENTQFSLNLKTGRIANTSDNHHQAYWRATFDCGQLSTASARSAATGITSNTFNGFTLAAIVVIVVAASAILKSLVF